jgi:hypothetical protein
MRKQTSLAIGVAIVAAIAGATVGNTQSTPANRQAWEYVMVEWRSMREAGLIRLGEQGWEMVAVTVEAVPGAAGNDTWYYFKRPK